MIRNGLYSFEAKALDGVEGGDSGTLVLRDGTIRGGTSFFYFIGTYSCSAGRWKGELTSEEHPNHRCRQDRRGRETPLGQL
jgi:hypothetical protein